MLNNLMENKFTKNCYKERYLKIPAPISLNADNSISKTHSLSHTPCGRSKFAANHSFISGYEKDMIRACKITNKEIKQIEDKLDVFMTEIEDRLGSINNYSPTRKAKIPYSPEKEINLTQNVSTQLHSPQLPVLKRRSKALKHEGSIEKLMNTSNNFHRDPNSEVLSKLQKSLGAIKTPCIEELYTKITRNERSFESYKNIRHNIELDPFKAFSQACSDEHVPPIPLLSKIQDKLLVLNRYRISDSISNALGDALKIMPYLTQLHLDENALTDAGGSTILKALAQQAQIISFFYTNNEIGAKFTAQLKGFLKKSPLTELNLRGCKTNGNSLYETIACFHQSKTLRKLFLADIGISNQCVKKLSSYIKRSKIIELDLSWNQISQEGSLMLFKALKSNKTLTSLDYSWNNLGSEEGDVCVILNHFLMQHPTLMHVNLSYTKLNDNSLMSLSPGLQTSKTLICVHLTGNDISQRKITNVMIQLLAVSRPGFISDSAAYVDHPSTSISLKNKPPSVIYNIKSRNKAGKSISSHRDKLANISSSSNHHDRLDGREVKELILSRYLGETTIKDLKAWNVSSHCWICERWVPYGFKLSPQTLEPVLGSFQWSTNTLAPIKLKCSFNLWEDIPLEASDNGDHNFLAIIPPGLHRLWVITNNSTVNITRQLTRKSWEGVKVNEIIVPMRNYDLEPIEAVFEAAVFDKKKSVFKNFVEDTDQTRKIMFDNDRKHFKLPRIIKDESELNAVYSVLISNFSIIKGVFDAVSASSNYPNIGWLDFSNFCERSKMIDKTLNRSAIDRCFIAVNVDFDDLDDNPQQELCRYEFFEIIVRLAMCKYQELPLSQAEMTQKFIDDHIFKYSDPSQALNFRKEKLYCFGINGILEANLSNCQSLFSKNRERIGRWISLEGYKNMTAKAGFNLAEGDIVKIFAFSKMSILDEMTNADSYDRMVFVEFLESLGRLSDYIYKDDTFSLAEKLEKCLGTLLGKFGLKVRAAEAEEEYSSDDSSN